ncbi:response regulator transcription factor, partial [Aliivibrio sifiae]
MKSNIIIVDDIEFSRKVISYIIKKKFNDEVNVIEAENSYDVERIIKSNIKINGIITDIIMPDGNGFDLINVLSMNNYGIPI